jgi:hypothetical protein
MGNHLHLLVRTQPAWVEQWTDEEVIRRWLRLYPRLRQKMAGLVGEGAELAILELLRADRQRIRSWRQRLASLSWFMKCLKEPIARRANRDDSVTGHFWEGRFKVQSLLDEAAVLACMAYIDLNPIRAGKALTAEESLHTSIRDRIDVRQWHRRMRRLRERVHHRALELMRDSSIQAWAPDEGGIWLAPVQRAPLHAARTCRDGLVGLALDEYLDLVDVSARHVRPGKRGATPAGLPSILSRLEIDAGRWLMLMRGEVRRVGTAVGSAAHIAAEAARRGTRWVVNAWPIHREAASP